MHTKLKQTNTLKIINFCIFITITLSFISCKYRHLADSNEEIRDSTNISSADTLLNSNELIISDTLFFQGDINMDGLLDKIAVTNETCDTNDLHGDNSLCKRVSIYVQKENHLELYAQNDKILDCSDCGGAGVGDPFRDIKIKNGYVSFESLYGDCDKSFIVITFKYNNSDKRLHLFKIGTSTYNCRDDESNSSIPTKETIETVKDFGDVLFENYGKR